MIKKDNNNQITDAEEQIKLKRLYLIKTKMETRTINSEEALRNLSVQARETQTSSVLLAGIIIMAENVTISKPEEQNTADGIATLHTDPELVPETTNVITNAVNNPNSNSMVVDIAETAAENLTQNTEETFRERVSGYMNALEEALRVRRQELQQDFSLNSVENAGEQRSFIPDSQYSVVEAQSKYGVVSSYGIIRDTAGKPYALRGTRDSDGKWQPEFTNKDKTLVQKILQPKNTKEL